MRGVYAALLGMLGVVEANESGKTMRDGAPTDVCERLVQIDSNLYNCAWRFVAFRVGLSIFENIGRARASTQQPMQTRTEANVVLGETRGPAEECFSGRIIKQSSCSGQYGRHGSDYYYYWCSLNT